MSDPRDVIANALSEKLMQTRRRCQSHADFVIDALKAAGYVIAVDPSPEALLRRSTDYLRRPHDPS